MKGRWGSAAGMRLRQPRLTESAEASEIAPFIWHFEPRDGVVELAAIAAKNGLDNEAQSLVCATGDSSPVTALGALEPISTSHANSSSTVSPKKAHQTGCARIHTVDTTVTATPTLAMRITDADRGTAQGARITTTVNLPNPNPKARYAGRFKGPRRERNPKPAIVTMP